MSVPDEIRAEPRAAGRWVRGGRPHVGGAPDPSAHRVRRRDAEGARILLRHRELLAHSRGRAEGTHLFTRSTTSPRTSSALSTSRTRRCRRSGGMYEVTARARDPDRLRLRLPSALDNRPLRFDEFLGKVADGLRLRDPGLFELRRSTSAEQLIRPTGIVDPEVELATKNQIDDLRLRSAARGGGRARARHHADQEDGVRTSPTTCSRPGSRRATCTPRSTRWSGSRSSARAPPRRLCGARRRQPAAGRARPAGGLARGGARRRQGGLPARQDRARANDRWSRRTCSTARCCSMRTS